MVLIFDEMGKIMKIKTSNGTFFIVIHQKFSEENPKKL